MLYAISIALALVLITFAIHYRALLWLASLPAKIRLNEQFYILVFVIILFLLHLIEIALYACAYNMSASVFDLGNFQGSTLEGIMEYMYYSAVIFTTLGLGDIVAHGHIRFITAIEALNGFLLLTWSASFTFVAMSRLWNWNDCCAHEPSDHHANSND